jgi:S1-C subfamily serine protease
VVPGAGRSRRLEWDGARQRRPESAWGASWPCSWIGIAAQNVPLRRRLVYEYKLPVSSGIMVTHIDPGSPAEASELREGDIIVSFAGEHVSAIDELQRLLTADQIGKRVPVVVLRGVYVLDLSVVPDHRPD